MTKPGNTDAWERFILRGKTKKLHLFVLSAETVDKYSVETIVANQMYIQRMDLTAQDLEKINWYIALCE